ncbi:MAG: hotdog fold thioesterase [Gammaproteobacteria bacterium]|nr:hotdog fold thioesterase [Gammaproteobacteria bacterium]
MSIWFKNTTLADIEAIHQRAPNLAQHLGIEWIELGDDFLRGRMAITPQLHQPWGLLHGGASVVLAESVGSTAACLTVDTSRLACVGVDISTSHLRGRSQGNIIATASPVRLGRQLQVWQVLGHDDDGVLINTTRLTMAVRSGQPR